MRSALVMLLLISISFAQFEEFDQKIVDCQHACCDANSGSWDSGMEYCDVYGGDEFGYYDCSNICLETHGEELSSYGSGNLCCAPGFLVFGLVLAVLRD